jgi:hypothetical protein
LQILDTLDREGFQRSTSELVVVMVDGS